MNANAMNSTIYVAPAAAKLSRKLFSNCFKTCIIGVSIMLSFFYLQVYDASKIRVGMMCIMCDCPLLNM